MYECYAYDTNNNIKQSKGKASNRYASPFASTLRLGFWDYYLFFIAVRELKRVQHSWNVTETEEVVKLVVALEDVADEFLVVSFLW